MTFEEVYDTLPGGWLTKEEALLLYESARHAEGAILEVGEYRGRSTVLLASFGRPLLCVDPFGGFDSDMSGDEVQRIFLQNMKERDIWNFVLYRQKIEDWLGDMRCRVGFAYLDGDHTYKGTESQIEVALACGAEIICIHDYADSGDGLEVKRAVDASTLKVVNRIDRLVRCAVE